MRCRCPRALHVFGGPAGSWASAARRADTSATVRSRSGPRFYYAWVSRGRFRRSAPSRTASSVRRSTTTAQPTRTSCRNHTEALRYAHLNAGIYSWWGTADGYPPTDLRSLAVTSRPRERRRFAGARPTTSARRYENPSVEEELLVDLEYLRDSYATKPAYLKVDGRFVVFVYGGAEDGCDSMARAGARRNTVGAVHRAEGVRRLSHLERATGRVASVLRGAPRARPRAGLVHDRPRASTRRAEQAPRLGRDPVVGGRTSRRCSRRMRVGSSCPARSTSGRKDVGRERARVGVTVGVRHVSTTLHELLPRPGQVSDTPPGCHRNVTILGEVARVSRVAGRAPERLGVGHRALNVTGVFEKQFPPVELR